MNYLKLNNYRSTVVRMYVKCKSIRHDVFNILIKEILQCIQDHGDAILRQKELSFCITINKKLGQKIAVPTGAHYLEAPLCMCIHACNILFLVYNRLTTSYMDQDIRHGNTLPPTP